MKAHIQNTNNSKRTSYVQKTTRFPYQKLNRNKQALTNNPGAVLTAEWSTTDAKQR